MKRGYDAYYNHTNHLGSCLSMSDNSGEIKEYIYYDVFGLPTFINANGDVVSTSLVDNHILFTGREYDSDFSIYSYRTRSLHTMIGRFLQRDLLMYIDGLNDYSYVNNSVIGYIDPNGTEMGPHATGKLLGGLFIGGIGGTYVGKNLLWGIGGAALLATLGYLYGTLEDAGKPMPNNPFDNIKEPDYTEHDKEMCCKAYSQGDCTKQDECMKSILNECANPLRARMYRYGR